MKIKLQQQSNKFYDFQRDGVTQSMLQSFLTDPQECRLAYVEGWKPIESKDYFVFGGIVHHVIEKVLENKVPPTTSVIKNLVNSWLDDYLKETTTFQQIEEVNELVPKAVAVCNCYFKKYFSDFAKNWICLEKEFCIPYVYPDGFSTYIRGKIDLVELEENGYLVEYDTKTYSKWNQADAMILLPVDLQLNTYAYAITQLFPEYKLRKIYLNVIKKPTHKWTSKEKSAEEYQAKLETAYLANLDEYFVREPISYQNEQAFEWKKTLLDPLMLRVREWVNSNYTWPGYYNPCTLEGKYGLRPLTRMLIDNDIMGYTKKIKPFPELDYR